MNRNRIVGWVLCAALALTFSAASFAQVLVSVRVGPPALPLYAQPVGPGPGYLWTPGYWGWNYLGGYYWVPGTWVVAPVGMLWTPGYWGWGGGLYAWHPGYWGPHVGFYGGINYGFGYGGVGFAGGEWRNGGFFYNRAVMNVDTVRVTNVYTRTVVVNENHVAFNGGEGGIAARPTVEEERWSREPHSAALSSQVEHEHAASQNRGLLASENHGRPEVAATARPGEFSGHDVVKAHAAGAEYHAPAISPREARASAAESSARSEESRSNSRTPEARTENKERGDNARESRHEDSRPAKQQKEQKPSKQSKHEKPSREDRDR